MKKIFSIILTLAMVLSMMNAPMVQAATAVDIGEDWAVWVEDDCSTGNSWVPYYSYNKQLNKTYGYVNNAHSTQVGSVTGADHFMAMNKTLAVDGDFVAEFDLFMDDLSYATTLKAPGYFRVGVYSDITDKDSNHKQYSSLYYETMWNWSSAEVKDDTDVAYKATTARASKKYGVEAVSTVPDTFGSVSAEDENKYLNMKFVSVGDNISVYVKWNNSSKWRKAYSDTITSYDGAKGFVFHFGAFVGLDNLKIYRPIADIPKTPMQESETWGVQLKDDCSTTASWTPFYSYNLNKNSTYGYLNNAHSTQTGSVCNDLNHFLAMNKNIAVKGDFAADFDVFVDDLSYTNNLAKPNTFKLGMYSDIYTRTSETTKKDYTSLYSKTMFDWSTFTLADDAGVPHLANTARASKKYGVEAVATDTNSYYGTVSSEDTWNYMNMRFILIDNTITVYAKWDTSENWVEIHTGAITESDAAKGFVFHFDAFVGVDNLTIYRPKENIVKTPTTVTGSEFLGDDVDNMIVNPHFGTPAFTEPNGTVDVEFTNNTGVDFTKGTTDVYLSNEYKAWYAKAETPKSGENNIYLGTKSGWTTTITVPADISPELMDLEIIHTAADGTVTSYFAPQAVQVTEELNQDFYSVAISDTHIASMGNEYSSAKSARVLKYTNDSLAIANPRYLSHSGDIHDTAIADRKSHVKETLGYAFKDATVPFIVVAGNHEYDTYTLPVGESVESGRTAVTYEEYEAGLAAAADATAYKNSVQVKNTFTEKTFDEFFGTKTAAIKMGEDMLIAKHDFGAWRWLTDAASGDPRYNPVFIQLRDGLATEWEKDEYDGDYRVVYQHCYNTGKRSNGGYTIDVYGTAAFMSPTCHEGSENMTPYDMQYTGHYHETWPETDTVLTLGGNGKNEANWKGDGVISNFTYNANAAGKKWSNSTADITTGAVHAYDVNKVDEIQDSFITNANKALRAVYDEYYNENDGTAEFNIATITNTMDFNFYDGRVKFIMAPGKTYTVENGTKLAQYNSYDDKYTIVLAKVDIPAATEEANGVVNVTVKASDYVGSDLVLEGAETGYVGSDVTYLDLVSTAGISFTASDIAVKNNGYDVEFTVSSQGIGITRINFTKALTPNSSYTVTVSEQEFVFTVLPDEAIVFLDNTLKLGSGYDATAHGDSNYRMKVKTGTDENGKAVYTYANDYNYENYVLDYTVAMTSALSFGKAGFEESSMRWYIYSADDTGVTKTKTTSDYYFNQNTTRQSAFASSVLTNPLDIKAGYSYDFRVVKYNDTWKVYAKKVTDDRYDLLLSLSGSANGIYSGTGRTSLYFCSRSANTIYFNYKLYPIENAVTVDEKVGQEFDVTFDVQPKDLSSVTIDGVGDVTFTKTGVKTYKATMPSTWTKKSGDVTLSGITDVYSITAPDATLSAAEYEIDMRDVTIVQNNEETDSVKAGDYTVKVTCDKNYTLPEGTKLICAAYAGGSLVSVKTVDPEALEAMNYNGSEYTFDMTSEYDVSQIKLFAFNMNTLAPLAKSIQ